MLHHAEECAALDLGIALVRLFHLNSEERQCSPSHAGLPAQGNFDDVRTDKLKWLADNAEDLVTKLFNINHQEIEHTQPLTQNSILLIDAVGWHLFDEFKQAMLVHWRVYRVLPATPYTRTAYWLSGATFRILCTQA